MCNVTHFYSLPSKHISMLYVPQDFRWAGLLITRCVITCLHEHRWQVVPHSMHTDHVTFSPHLVYCFSLSSQTTYAPFPAATLFLYSTLLMWFSPGPSHPRMAIRSWCTALSITGKLLLLPQQWFQMYF